MTQPTQPTQPDPCGMAVRFTGTLDQVAAARGYVVERIGERHPYRHTVELLTSEVTTNAIQHTASGTSGDGQPGSFLLAVMHDPSWVRVLVTDAGADTVPCACPPVDWSEETGRGMLLLAAMSHRWGLTRAPAATTVWFDVGDRPDHTPTLASPAA